MTDRMSHRAPEQGKVRRAVAALGAFLNSLEYNSFDYTLERLELLEKEVGRLRRELGKAGISIQSMLSARAPLDSNIKGLVGASGTIANARSARQTVVSGQYACAP
jgi:hypothetical protein